MNSALDQTSGMRAGLFLVLLFVVPGPAFRAHRPLAAFVERVPATARGQFPFLGFHNGTH